MEEIAGILFRLAFAYVYLLALTRLSGKRTIGEVTPFDFMVTLIVSDFPDDIIWGEVPLAEGVVAVGTIMLLHLIVAYASYRSIAFAHLVESAPSPLVVNGEMQPAPMARERMNEQELDAELRLQQLDRRQPVQQGTLEPDGHFSVIRQEPFQPAEKQDVAKLKEALG
jgi:uncharacterized membrane protein YcaP (DUF421 family)